MQGVAPALWRGGRAAPIPKPGKPLSSKEGWRSILLHEASMKGICKLLRPPLLDCLERVRTQGQGGSRPGNPLQAPMAAARGFARMARAAGVTAGLLFVDARNAFYAVARQLLTGGKPAIPLRHSVSWAICSSKTGMSAWPLLLRLRGLVSSPAALLILPLDGS